MIPAKPKIDSQILSDLPIVLHVQPVVVIPQMDLFGFRRGAPSHQEQKNAAVYGAKVKVVIDSGK